MSRLAWYVLVNPCLISVSFYNLSKHFKAAAAREWLLCLDTPVSASLSGEGQGDPLTVRIAGTCSSVIPDPPVVGVKAGSEPALGSDPGAVELILGGVYSATAGGEMVPEREYRQRLPALYCGGCQHMGEERAGDCAAAQGL